MADETAERRRAYREKLLSVGVAPRGLSRVKVKEGREHPESGMRFRRTLDEHGNVVTEHGKPGSGVTDRQDVHIYQQEPVTLEVEV
jgi:hypothetical protein